MKNTSIACKPCLCGLPRPRSWLPSHEILIFHLCTRLLQHFMTHLHSLRDCTGNLHPFGYAHMYLALPIYIWKKMCLYSKQAFFRTNQFAEANIHTPNWLIPHFIISLFCTETLVHQLHLRKKQLKDLSSNPLPTRVIVNGTLPRANKQVHVMQHTTNSLHPSDYVVASRCKASSPVSRESCGSSTSYPTTSLLSAHGSYTLPTRGRQALHQREMVDKNAIPMQHIHGDMNGYHRNGHSRSHSRTSLHLSRTSLDHSDLEPIGSPHNIYEPVNNNRWYPYTSYS